MGDFRLSQQLCIAPGELSELWAKSVRTGSKLRAEGSAVLFGEWGYPMPVHPGLLGGLNPWPRGSPCEVRKHGEVVRV